MYVVSSEGMPHRIRASGVGSWHTEEGGASVWILHPVTKEPNTSMWDEPVQHIYSTRGEKIDCKFVSLELLEVERRTKESGTLRGVHANSKIIWISAWKPSLSRWDRADATVRRCNGLCSRYTYCTVQSLQCTVNKIQTYTVASILQPCQALRRCRLFFGSVKIVVFISRTKGNCVYLADWFLFAMSQLVLWSDCWQNDCHTPPSPPPT